MIIPMAVCAQAPVMTPRRLVQVAAVELKVSAVTVAVPTPSGNPASSTNELQQPGEFGSGLSEMLLSALAPSRTLLPQDPGSVAAYPAPLVLRAIITELMVHNSTGIGVGALQGTGSQRKNRSTVGMDLRLVEVRSGLVLESVHVTGDVEAVSTNVNWQQGQKITWSAARSASLGEAARRAFEAGIRKLDQRLATQPWEGLVVELGEESGAVALYINAGQKAGLKSGDLLEVRRPGPLLRDPETGQSLGRAPGRVLGRARIHSLTDTLATVVPLIPGSYQIGDTVHFLSRDKK